MPNTNVSFNSHATRRNGGLTNIFSQKPPPVSHSIGFPALLALNAAEVPSIAFSGILTMFCISMAVDINTSTVPRQTPLIALLPICVNERGVVIDIT